MKIFAIFFVALISTAMGQISSPKPSAPSGPASPSPQQPAPAQPAEPPVENPFVEADLDRVVATIGDDKITASDFEAIVQGLDPRVQAQVRGPYKRQFIENVVTVKILARQAALMHLDQSPAAKQQIEYETDKVLAAAVYQAILANARVNSELLHKYYEEHKQDFLQLWARHILIPFKGYSGAMKEGQKLLTEEEALAKAQELVKRLKAGEDFATLAAAESADAASAAKGGEIGVPIKRGQTPKPFEDAAFALSAGQVSDPVKGQFGYEIIRVDKFDVKSFDDARAELEVKLKPVAAKQQVDALKAKVSVDLDEKFFGPPPPASRTAANGPQPNGK